MRVKYIRIGSLLLFIAVPLLLAGCWNSRELRDLAIVIGMGVDKQPDTNKYIVSFQVVNPGSIPNGSKGGGGTGAVPVTVYSAASESLFGALRLTSQKLPRQLFFSHIQLIVIGESVAKEGIAELFDFFERSHEVRNNIPVLVSRGQSAEDLLKIITPLENTPATGIAKRLELTSQILSVNANTEVTDIVRALNGEREAIISGVRVKGEVKAGQSKSNLEKTELPAAIEISGIGLFKDGKLKTWLGLKESRGTLWLLNEMKSTIVEIACDSKEEITIEVTRSRTSIKAGLKSGRPHFRIEVEEEGDINEIQCPVDVSKRETLIKLQEVWAKDTKKEIVQAIEKAQAEKSDILGFGEEMFRSHPREWKKLKKDWPEIFAGSTYEVKVEAYIRNTGMRTKTLLE